MYEDFSSYEFSVGDDIFVLIYTYPMSATYTFAEAIESVVDEFNHWYSDNSYLLQNWIDTRNDELHII